MKHALCDRQAEYAAFLDSAVRERDFLTFEPWREGHAENGFTWRARVIRSAAQEFGRDPEAVAHDLERLMEERRRHNKRMYLRRVPAVLALFYRRVLKGEFVQWIVLPLSQWKYGRRVRKLHSTASSRVSHLRPRAGSITPTASIVVVSFNRLAYLLSTLESLSSVTNREDFELIVVDNGSTDGSPQALRNLANERVIDKLILQKENRGTSGGFNVGFACADPSTRFLIKLDSDIMLLTPGWLGRFESFFQSVPGVGLVALRQINHLALRVAPTQTVGGETVISWNHWIAGGACMTIPRSVFAELGYFCEDFQTKYMPDDVDYAVRVALLGLRSFYLCGTLAYHRNDLDHYYRELLNQRQREVPASDARRDAICRQYTLRQRDLYVSYPRYAQCVFPIGQRILEIQ